LTQLLDDLNFWLTLFAVVAGYVVIVVALMWRGRKLRNAYESGRHEILDIHSVKEGHEIPFFLLAYSMGRLARKWEPPPFGSLSRRQKTYLWLMYRSLSDEVDQSGAEKLWTRSKFRIVLGASKIPSGKELDSLLYRARIGVHSKLIAPVLVKRIAPDFIQWLETTSDPAMWHALVDKLNYDHSIAYQTVKWIVEQPQCLAATALLATRKLEVAWWCGKAANTKFSPDEKLSIEIIKLVTRLSTKGFHRDYTFGVVGVTEPEFRAKTLVDCRSMAIPIVLKGQRSACVPPLRLLRAKFGTKAIVTKFEVGEDGVFLPGPTVPAPKRPKALIQ
jgi:hypothetical protein